MIEAVRKTIGAPAIFGAPAELIARLGVENRDRLLRLEELAGELLPGCRAPSRAAAVLAQAVEDGALDRPSAGPALDPIEGRRRSLEAQLAAYQRVEDIDPETIDRLISELEDLGGA